MKTYLKIIYLIFLVSLLIPLFIKAITFENPFANVTLEELMNSVFNFILWVAIAITFPMIIVAAYYFLTSGGDPEKVRTAKRIIFWVVIGLIIIFLAKSIPYIIKQIIEGPPPPVEICDNGVDDDGDNLPDCLDPDCAIDPTACPCLPQICQDLLTLVASNYGARCGDSGYDPIADINKDQKIDMRDIGLVASKCGDAIACQNTWNNASNPCP